MTGWLNCFDEDLAVFIRPLKERLQWGITGGAFACIASGFLFATQPWHQLPTVDWLIFCIVFCILPLIIFAFRAGPKEMCFGFRQGQYRYRMGILFFSWTRSGSLTEISCLHVLSVRDFRGLSIEWKSELRSTTAFASCSTREEAQQLAKKLGEKMNVPVKKGVAGAQKVAAKDGD